MGRGARAAAAPGARGRRTRIATGLGTTQHGLAANTRTRRRPSLRAISTSTEAIDPCPAPRSSTKPTSSTSAAILEAAGCDVVPLLGPIAQAWNLLGIGPHGLLLVHVVRGAWPEMLGFRASASRRGGRPAPAGSIHRYIDGAPARGAPLVKRPPARLLPSQPSEGPNRGFNHDFGGNSARSDPGRRTCARLRVRAPPAMPRVPEGADPAGQEAGLLRPVSGPQPAAEGRARRDEKRRDPGAARGGTQEAEGGRLMGHEPSSRRSQRRQLLPGAAGSGSLAGGVEL